MCTSGWGATKRIENLKHTKKKIPGGAADVTFSPDASKHPRNRHTADKAKQASGGMRNGTPPAKGAGDVNNHADIYLILTKKKNPLLASCEEQPARCFSGGILVHSSTHRGLPALEGSPGTLSDC